MNRTIIAAAVISAFATAAQAAEPVLTVPFDYSRAAIGVDVLVKGKPLYMLLDTGVDPSAIDLIRAETLGLPVDKGTSGEAAGEGDATQAQIFAATIEDLSVGGRAFHAIDAAAMDMTTLSARYGRQLDGVLGYSFLTDKIVLIDYPHSALSIVTSAADAVPLIRMCRTHYSLPLRSFEGDQIPVIREFRIGNATMPISLDTGSNKGVGLYTGALDLPGVRAAMTEKGEVASTGARGNTITKTYALNAAIGFGPFTLPAGEIVSVRNSPGSADTALANIGNPIFAAMKLKILFDYPARRMTFYGDCR